MIYITLYVLVMAIVFWPKARKAEVVTVNAATSIVSIEDERRARRLLTEAGLAFVAHHVGGTTEWMRGAYPATRR